MSYKLKIETLLYLFVLGLLYYLQCQNTGGIYIDTDNYMHALRTIDFINQPSMFEHKFIKTNYPFGEVSHWTRLMDILMAVCALPFLVFTDLKNAVFCGGFVLIPLCALATFYFLQKFGYQYLGTGSRFALYSMLLMSAPLRMVYKINRPDHHGVILLFAAWLLWLLGKYTSNRQKKTIIQAALLCAAALWLAAEGVFLYACALIFLYLGYISFKFSYGDLVRFSSFYALGCLFFWFINPPFEGYFYADNGRLSILFVVLALFATIIIYCSQKFANKIWQFAFLAVSGLAGLGVLWFGGYMISPLVPEITEAFTNRISEMQGGGTVYYLAYPVLGLLAISVLLFKRQVNHITILLLCFLLPYTVLSFFTMRFSAYAILYGIVAIAYWLHSKRFGKIKFVFLTLLLCLTEFVSFIVYSLFCYDLTKPVKEAQVIDVNFLERYSFPQGSVVTDVFFSPNILWYANRPTVASPYHRNVEGIVDNHRILQSSDMSEIAELIKKHQVGTIILPLNMDEEYYKNPDENTDKLYGKMSASHEYPSWLKEDENARKFGYVVLKVLTDKLPLQ